jgi:restriction endonuclease
MGPGESRHSSLEMTRQIALDRARLLVGKGTGKPLLYLVRETKSTHDRDKWHPDERRRVACGERHFRDALDVNYRVVISASELP